MDFNFTEEQGMVRDGLSRLVREQYGFEERRKAIASAEGWRPEIWAQLAELGILGMPFSAVTDAPRDHAHHQCIGWNLRQPFGRSDINLLTCFRARISVVNLADALPGCQRRH